MCYNELCVFLCALFDKIFYSQKYADKQIYQIGECV